MQQTILTPSASSRERFLNALTGRNKGTPPAWIMRQAGRYLPEYRALKSKYSFKEMVRTPELATEVTLQPLQRFDLDAAILFSDILVVPEAMGQPYHFREEGGIGMDFALGSSGEWERIHVPDVADTLGYVGEALKLLKAELGEEKALLGFGGAPWTLAAYMIQGSSSPLWPAPKSLFFSDRPRFEGLMEKITTTIIDYFRMQARSGADAIQIFDSWAAACPADHYEEMSLRWIRHIIAELEGLLPVILYAKDPPCGVAKLLTTGANVIGFSWTASLGEIRQEIPSHVGIQGNLDPALLTTSPEVVANEVRRLRQSMSGANNWIFNLGHGITPDAQVECVEAALGALRAE